MTRAVGDPRRLLAGTDCGFDASASMGRVAEDVVRAKLKWLAESADRVGTAALSVTRPERPCLGEP